MTNKDIYAIAYRLGMIEDADRKVCNDKEETPLIDPAELFDEMSATDLISVMQFVDDLTLYNDLETIKKFLVAVIWENRK